MKKLFIDDVKFYEEYVSKLSLEDQAKFFKEHPDFMKCDEKVPEELREMLQNIINQKS